MLEPLLDAEVHGFRCAYHGDGQQHVVADLHGAARPHSPAVGDLGPHVPQQPLRLGEDGLRLGPHHEGESPGGRRVDSSWDTKGFITNKSEMQ